MRTYKPYDVTVEVTRSYILHVYGRTPEQAEEEALLLVEATDNLDDLADRLESHTEIRDVLPTKEGAADATGFPE